MTTVTQKLAMTELDYEMMVFGFYGRWCESNSGNTRQYQTLLANAAINAWFLMELAKCEAEFVKIANGYEHQVAPKDLQACYNDVTYHLFNIRPTALLEALKTKGSIKLRSSGIPVFNGLNVN